MPTLPTLTVTQAQADYLLGVFGTQQAYRDWLLRQLKGEIMRTEMESARADAQAMVEQRRVDLEAKLNGISTTV